MANAWAALALVSNAFIWGISWWPFRQLQALGLHPLWSTALVFLCATLAVLALRPASWRGLCQAGPLWLLLLAAGAANAGFNWAVTAGDVVRAVLLFYLMPAWVLLLAWPLLGERPTRVALARLALALAGVVVVLKGPDSPWPWPLNAVDLLALGGGLAFGLTNVLLRKLHGVVAASHSMLAMFAGGALVSGLAAALGTSQGLVTALPAPDTRWPLWIAGVAVLFLLGNLGLQYGAARLSAGATSIIMLSEVVFASGSSVLMGASGLPLRTLCGGALIVLAALWSALASAPTAPGV